MNELCRLFLSSIDTSINFRPNRENNSARDRAKGLKPRVEK